MKSEYVDVVIIGSGAAGLSCAVHLHRMGRENIAIYTEGLDCGTSINSGSDKQTYYKLGMYGAECDSPLDMAKDLTAGGSMQGDVALVEASASARAFFNLVELGVPFPHDIWGEYAGYKTDHDPRRRATSMGPYTSREMCCCLRAEVLRRKIPVREKKLCVQLLTEEIADGVEDAGRTKRCTGAVFVDQETGAFQTVFARAVVFAVGGPGGLYAHSVYPESQMGAIGVALEAGAQAINLAESQFGLASTGFRWNVSGSYMQVVPRFISVDADGTEREFLRAYFASPADLFQNVFLKGYQWPFCAAHVPGSSQIDLFVHAEMMKHSRRVFLDYRSNPQDFSVAALDAETREYLQRSGALQETPVQRLRALNEPAYQLYLEHGIDLEKQPLEIAVCAQHNNGGLAADIWWESLSVEGLFPIGEVCGTHGVSRPGGSALNSGQVGALRAAQCISVRLARGSAAPCVPTESAVPCVSNAAMDWRRVRGEFQHRMSASGAFLRRDGAVQKAYSDAVRQWKSVSAEPQALSGEMPSGLVVRDFCEALRNRSLCLAHVFYLNAICEQVKSAFSRGGSLVQSGQGDTILKENEEKRNFVMYTNLAADGLPASRWERCTPIPSGDGWFETIWKHYRETFQNTGK